MTMAEKDTFKGLLPPLVGCLRMIAQTMPRLNVRGELVTLSKGATGRQAKKDTLDESNTWRKKQIDKFIHAMPSYPLLEIASPEARALQVFKDHGYEWTERSIEKAAAEFRVPSGTKVLLVMPELFCRDALIKLEQFQVKTRNPETDTDKVTGVMPCCPWCKSNKKVEFKLFECQNSKYIRKAIGGNSEITPLFGARYCCRSFVCVGPVPAGEADSTGDIIRHNKNGKVVRDADGLQQIWSRAAQQANSHSFNIWNKACFSQFPKKVCTKPQAGSNKRHSEFPIDQQSNGLRSSNIVIVAYNHFMNFTYLLVTSSRP